MSIKQTFSNTEIYEIFALAIIVNVYVKSNADAAVDVIRKKKYAAVKLITKAGSDLGCPDLILRSREIIASNFVCIVFSPTGDHIEWIPEMENVLLTLILKFAFYYKIKFYFKKKIF